jgi:putative membrane protein
VLFVVFVIYWLAWAIRPVNFRAWCMENTMTVIFAGILVATRRRFPFSNLSYGLLFLFLCIHTIGAHYTYSYVPYDRWALAIFGKSINQMLGWQRNHFDRWVHFLFGLMLVYPAREIFVRVAGARGFWGYYLPVDVVMSFSMMYELLEWAAGVLLGGEAAMAYLGTQGDIWDAHKDMALATLGAMIAMGIVGIVQWRINRDFAREFWDSFTSRRGPLGEKAIAESRENAM